MAYSSEFTKQVLANKKNNTQNIVNYESNYTKSVLNKSYAPTTTIDIDAIRNTQNKKTSEEYLNQYYREFKESEKAKGGLYNTLLGGNIFAEKSFRDNSETYKKYLQALEDEKKAPNTNISKQISDGVVNFVQNPNLIKSADNWKDGYQVGDVLKTAGSTAASLGTSAVKGIFGLGESIGDLGQYGVAQVADWLGADDFANQVRDNAKFNATETIFSPAEELYKKNSIAGDTSNQIAQGIGYIAGMSAGGGLLPKKTQSINVGKFSLPTTSIVSGMGNSMTEAYNNDANDGEAWVYGALSGLTEAFSESLFGGLGNTFKKVYGGGALDDVIVDKLTKNITNRSMRILAQSGLKAVGEGTEEIVSGLGSALAKKMTYMSEENLGKLVNDEKLLDQFIMGTLTSLVAQTPSTVQSVKTGQDYVSLNNQDLSPNVANNNQVDQNIETLSKYSAMGKNNVNNNVLKSKYQYMPTNNEKINYTGNANLTFAEQVDKWKNGEFRNDTHLVMFKETPELYKKIGLKDNPFTLIASKLDKVYNSSGKQKGNYHGLQEMVKQLPEALENPLNIVQSTTDDNSIVVITHLSDQNDNIVIASVKIDGTGQVEIENVNKNIDSNVLTSAYGKENYDYQLKPRKDGMYTGWMEENVKNDRIIYDIDEGIKKQRVEGKWVSFPNTNNSFSNDNISQQDKSVKSDTLPKYSMQENINNTQELDNSSFSLKQKQLDIILKNNPVQDDYHTWIRTVDDIKTLEETIADSDWADYDEFNPDLTKKDIEDAINSGKIMVYSSYPIGQGIFVSPSRMEAESYSSDGKVYSKEVNIDDVAWIDPTQGQYAKVNEEKYSQSNPNWQEHLEKNYKAIGTRTNMQELRRDKLPTYSQNNIQKNKNNNVIKNTVQTKAKNDSNNKNVRKWSETITQSQFDKEVILEAMKGQDYTYVPDSNRKQWERAKSKIESQGYEKAKETLIAKFNSGSIFNVDDAVLGEKLLQEASQKKDIETFREILSINATMGTELGRATQALSIIKKLSPEGQLTCLQKTVENMKNKVKGAENLELTNEMIDKILKSKNSDELVENITEVENELSKQIKSTNKDKFIAWRYLSMLGNPKTHMRNLVSNFAMKETTDLKNMIARTGETVFSKVIRNAGQERTKTFKKSTKTVMDFVNNYAVGSNETLKSTSKYSMELEIKKAQKVFGDKGFGKFVQTLYDLNSKGLELEDSLFRNSRFKSSMAEYLTANGIETQTDIDNNPKLVNNAVLYATEESLKATFQQFSALASTLNQLKHKSIAGEFVLDALMPFIKTPANILKTGASYSPLGLAKSILIDTVKLKQGKITITQYIDNISQGLTGTGIVLLGYALAQAGIIRSGGDDDKEDDYEEALGKQEYSVNIGGQSFTLDWLSPVAMPLFVGAELCNIKENGLDDTLNMNTMTSMLTTTFDPMMNMSLLQGINNAMSSYSNNNKLMAVVEESIKSYISQLFPTIGGQIAKTIDPTIRSTSASKDSGWTLGEQILRTNMAKIPGLSYFLEPSLDVWGNERQRSDSIITRAFENFIAPYTRKEDITSGVDKELQKIYSQTGEDSVIPTMSLSKTITYKGEKYQTDASSYTEFKKTYGKEAHNTLNKLFKTDTYKKADEEEKVKMINRVYEYAKDVAKKEFLGTKGVTYTNTTKDNVDIYKENDIIEAIKYDVSVDAINYKNQNPQKYQLMTNIKVDYYDYNDYKKKVANIKDTYTGSENSEKRKQEIFKYINSLNYNKYQKIILYNMLGGYTIKDYKNDIYNYINGLKISKSEKQAMWQSIYGS